MLIKPPGESFHGPLPALTEEQRRLSNALQRHVDVLATQIGERNVWRKDALDNAEQYIRDSLTQFGLAALVQEYRAEGQVVRNIIAEIPGDAHRAEIIVVGAHYDSVRGCPAANDNGSGVAAVLEVADAFARAGAQRKHPRTIRFVFFVNEEPPFFQTDLMVSMVYAKACRAKNENIVAMISVETIGCYSDEKGSQKYPPIIARAYPDVGNFIAFVSSWGSKQLMFDAIKSFRQHAKFPSEGGAAPALIEGVGWSDHWSFWQYDYPAIMVTDTAPYRYAHYHEPTDTAEKLDYDRVARVVEGLIHVVEDLAQR